MSNAAGFRWTTTPSVESNELTQRAGTWDEFAESIAHGIGPKEGSCFVFCRFKDDGGKRRSENVEAVTAIGLDFDAKDGVKFEDVALLDDFLGVAWTTHSHTAEAHAFRVVLPLSREITLDEFGKVWAWFRNNVPGVDVSAGGAVRCHYQPRRADETSPWLVQRTLTGHGEAFDPDRAIAAMAQEPAAPAERPSEDAGAPARLEGTYRSFHARAVAGESRNDCWFRLCLQLRDHGVPEAECGAWAERWVQDVGALGGHRYTITEARKTIGSVFSRPARGSTDSAGWDANRDRAREDQAAAGDDQAQAAESSTEVKPTSESTGVKPSKPAKVKAAPKATFPFDKLGDDVMAARDIVGVSRDLYYVRDPELNIWRPEKPVVIERMANELNTYGRMRSKDVGEVVAYIRRTTGHSAARIHWNNVADDEVPFRNGVFNISTGDIRDHNPRVDMLDRVIPHDVDPEAHGEPRTWLRCLEDWFGPESKEAVTLQQFFGYCLMSHVRYQKALWLVGEGGTGKSVILAVLSHLFDYGLGSMSRGISSLPISQLSSARKVAALVGQWVNVVSEVGRKEVLGDAGFKAIVGGDAVVIDPKFQDPVTRALSCKLIIATNNFPQTDDATDGTWRRVLVIPMNRKIHRPDRDLIDKLKAETREMVVWAIRGARLLAQQGKFTESDLSEDAREEYRDEQNVVMRFIEEYCELDPDGWASTKDLRVRFQDAFPNDRMPSGAFAQELGIVAKRLGLRAHKWRKRDAHRNQGGYLGLRLS